MSSNSQAISTSEGQNKGTAKTSGLWKPILLLAIVVAILVLSYVFNLGEKLAAFRGWIDSLGAWGPVVFIAIYVVATLAAIPGSALTVIAGALFGSVLGVIVVSIASTTGAALCFLVARYFARDAVANWAKKKEKFRRLDKLTEEFGDTMVAITRLVPAFPFNLLNYGFGLTRVRFWTYVFWSWLCMLPGTLLYVVGTDAIVKAIKEGRIPWLLVAFVAVIVVILTFIVRSARRKLRARISEVESDDSSGSEVADHAD